MINKLIKYTFTIFTIIVVFSCGTYQQESVVINDDYITIEKHKVSKEQIIKQLLSEGYGVDTLEGDDLFTNFKSTDIDDVFFKVEVYSEPMIWKLRGKIKYKVYKTSDKEVYNDVYVNSNQEPHLLKYGWKILEETEKRIIK